MFLKKEKQNCQELLKQNQRYIRHKANGKIGKNPDLFKKLTN